MGTTPQNEEQMVKALEASIAASKTKRRAEAAARRAGPELLAVLERHLAWYDGEDIDEGFLIEATRAVVAKARGAK